MTKYDSYKESGIEWLGEIPKHWEVKKVKHLFELGRGRVIAQTELLDNGYPVYSSQTQNDGCLGYISTYDYNIPQLTWTTDGANAGTVFIRDGEYNCTNVCGTLAPYSNTINLKYSYYMLQFATEYYKRPDTNGAKIMNNEMAVISISSPPLEEQQAIADYLDEQTQKIDSLIENKQKLIDLLKERRSSLISETVTKGLNPNAEMKDSGIEWLGEIPSHWEAKKIKYVFNMNTGLSITKAELEESGIPCVGYGIIHSKYMFELNLSIHELPFVNEKYIKSNPNTIATTGDFIFCDTSEDIEGCGNMLYVSETMGKPIFAGSHTILMRPNQEVVSRFIAYQFKSELWKNQIRTQVSGVKVYSITQTILKNTDIILPPLEEQEIIADYLDYKTNNIDKLIHFVEVNINKLKEYRQSLISEVVTGKWKYSMNNKLKEIKFEEEIEQYLLEQGWEQGFNKDYNKELALDTKHLFDFIKNSQPKEWENLVKFYKDQAEEELLDRLNKSLKSKGTLHTLREGLRGAHIKFNLMYIRPVSTMNQTAVDNYQKNILSITRQVYYSTKNNKSVDCVLFINGIPFSTLELKNGYNLKVSDAKQQYKSDRDPRELLFRSNVRAIVHFAIDPDEVYMTTRLQGGMTSFLPFNKGDNEGKGNPLNPHGSKTAYLWEDILQKDSIIDILHRFIHADSDRIIFPRYHQLDVVRKLVNDVKTQGAGQNYLIQHSAGSGKSNSIAWLAHHLQNLHDMNNQIVFDSVIVITDRRVLDNQLQTTIHQFDHEEGVVERIEKDAKQLQDAITKGKKIIITTLQKFPFIETLTTVKAIIGKRFAIIIDEAHSSQSGDSHTKMKQTLGAPNTQYEESDDDIQNQINEEISKQGKLPNLSFFALTATPKPKTVEIFGTAQEGSIPKPFHLYSMKQAIEEGFILDVLKNYQTYERYFKLNKAIADNPEYSVKMANRALAKYVNAHSHNLIRKTEVMIEHFRSITMNKIGGKAKAMLVTSSREQAVHYFNTFKEYIAQKGYQNEIKILVAFSGELMVNGNKVTEEKLNHLKETEVPKEFHDNYHLLIVAEKYQTGFDEPLLHTMFVDKHLDGVKAVQTLSRLNRTYPLKEDTFILDFVNSVEAIKESFDPYYKETEIDEKTDLHLVYESKDELDNYRIYWEIEAENFSKVFFNAKNKKYEFSKVQAYITPAIDRFNGKPQEEQDGFKSHLMKFIRLYSLITNMVALNDPELHKFYAYAKVLSMKLPYKDGSTAINFDKEVELAYYRLQSVYSGSIELEGEVPLENAKHVSSKSSEDLKDSLAEIIKHINDTFGANLTEEDILFIQQIYQRLEKDEQIQAKAKSNSLEHFALPLRKEVENSIISSYDNNTNFVDKFLTNNELLIALTKHLAELLHKNINNVK